MITLSTRAREAIKTGLAMMIAMGWALSMDWSHLSWVGFAVAMISLSTAGQSLNKGAMRMVGTLIGAPIGLLLIALFAQDRGRIRLLDRGREQCRRELGPMGVRARALWVHRSHYVSRHGSPGPLPADPRGRGAGSCRSPDRTRSRSTWAEKSCP
jgi:hypothetical protein